MVEARWPDSHRCPDSLRRKMALDAGPFMRLGMRGSPSWPGFDPETGYVDADCSDQLAETACRRGGPYVCAGRRDMSADNRRIDQSERGGQCRSSRPNWRAKPRKRPAGSAAKTASIRCSNCHTPPARLAGAGRQDRRTQQQRSRLDAVKSGVGIGPLPTAIADDEPDLVRVLGPIPELARSWRLLTHPDLRRTPRIAAFFDFIAEERDALKSILTG